MCGGAAAALAMIVMVMGVFGLRSGVFRLAAAAMLGFAVAVVAAASAFGVVMFLMIMILLIVHNVPLRAVNRVCSADSTPWSPLQSQAPDENYC